MKRKTFDEYESLAEKCSFGAKMNKADYEAMDDDEHGRHMGKLGKAEEGGDDEEDPEKDPDEERDERDDPEDDPSEKSLSGMTEDELSKAMDTILGTASRSGKTPEQIRLEDLSKASAEGTLTRDQSQELIGLLELSPVGSQAAERFQKSMDGDPDVQEAMALDATKLVAGMIAALTKSLDGMGDEIGELRKSSGAFNRDLAEGLDVFARTVDAKLDAIVGENAGLKARLEAVEKSAVAYRGRAYAHPQTPASAIRDPRAPVDVKTLTKGGAVPTRVAKLIAVDLLVKSSDPDEMDQLQNLVCRLDTFHGADWRALPEATANPTLTAKVIARATA